MAITSNTHPAELAINEQSALIECRGDWTVNGIINLSSRLASLSTPSHTELTLDGGAIEAMDSAGAWLLRKCITTFEHRDSKVSLQNFVEDHRCLLDIVSKEEAQVSAAKSPDEHKNVLYRIGEASIEKCLEAHSLLNFVGEFVVIFLRTLRHPSRIQWRPTLITIDVNGYQALPIVGLLSFLVGVILSYQMGMQLKAYGANIFIVNVTGTAILREFGALVTAIILAGRTGSAFTAQIGTMKVNEEIDALRTMGLSPMNRLVIPRVIGLLVALPLLTVWANFWGIAGAMLMAKINLDVSYIDFANRFESVMTMRTYLIGLSKSPFYAAVIALVGCFQGFRVAFSAESVGHRTTVSVVQSIFLVIIVDALFSFIYSWQGI